MGVELSWTGSVSAGQSGARGCFRSRIQGAIRLYRL